MSDKDRIYDMAEARRKFFRAMKKRTDQKDALGFFGWSDADWHRGMRRRIQDKVETGHWVDVANFSMFLWNLDGRAEK